jgi:hypothetical protein
MSGIIAWGLIQLAEIVGALIVFVGFFNLPEEWQLIIAGGALFYWLSMHLH